MAVAGVCHSDDHYATGDGVMSPELTAIVEATGGRLRSISRSSAGTKARASSKKLAQGCGRYGPVTASRPPSSPRAVPVGGACPA